jgi:hypothetical protein
MARAELDILLNKLQGRLTGDSDFYLTNRYGKTVVSNYPLHKNPKSLSDNQRATFAAFGEVSKQAKSEMNDPARFAYWQERYAAYRSAADMNLAKANLEFFGETNGLPNIPKDKYYATLRGFIIGQLLVQNKQAE